MREHPSVDMRRSWVAQTAGAARLKGVLDVLGAASIPVVAVKGVVTARLLYDDPAERWLGDVDLRIRRRDFRRARAIVRDRFELLAASSPYENLVFDGGGIMVDLETTVGPPGLCDLTVDAILERASWISLGGTRVLAPAIADHAIVIAVNVFKDKLEGAAGWAIEDAARVVRHPTFSPGDFCETARRSSVREIAYVVARFFEERGHAAWSDLRRRLGPGPPRPIYDRLLGRALRRPASPSARLVARVASDRARSWPRALASALHLEAWKVWQGDLGVIRVGEGGGGPRRDL